MNDWYTETDQQGEGIIHAEYDGFILTRELQQQSVATRWVICDECFDPVKVLPYGIADLLDAELAGNNLELMEAIVTAYGLGFYHGRAVGRGIGIEETKSQVSSTMGMVFAPLVAAMKNSRERV